jgi:HK97 family phage prohead protease
MPELEYRKKRTIAYLKAFDEEKGILKGYASVGGFADSYGDIVEPGAYRKTLREHKDRIRMCWQHDFREPLGRPHVLKEHDHNHLPEELLEKYPEATCGLYFECRISDTTRGRDAKTLLRDGVLDEMSIGYDIYPDGEHLDEKGFNHLTDIILYEYSLVTMAAMPAAMVTDYKALKPEETEDYIRIPIEGISCTITATIDIDKDKGIKALYCGAEKKVRTLLFAKAKGWTMESAQKWYEDHKEDFKLLELGETSEKEFEEKIGRVISKKNEDKLRQAADLITEVLSSLDEEDKARGTPRDSEPVLGQEESEALRAWARRAELEEKLRR